MDFIRTASPFQSFCGALIVRRLRIMTTPLGTVALQNLVLPALAEMPGLAPDEVLKGVFEMVAVDATGRPTAIDRSYLDQETTT
jgi:hypothetical protein